VLAAEGTEGLADSAHRPQANSIAERWCSSARREALDWLLVVNVGGSVGRAEVPEGRRVLLELELSSSGSWRKDPQAALILCPIRRQACRERTLWTWREG